MDGGGPIANGATIADSSGNGNDATMVGGTASYVAGQFNQAIQVTGGNSVSLSRTPPASSSPSGPPTSGSTAVRPAIFTATVIPTGPHDSFGTEEYYNGTSIFFTVPNVNGGWWNTGIAATVGTLSGWNMVTTSVSASGYQLYLNGTSISSGSWTATPGTNRRSLKRRSQAIRRGAVSTAYTGNFNGSIDDFSLSSSVLSPAQVQSLYLGQTRWPTAACRGTPR